jgi:hypothetical protein
MKIDPLTRADIPPEFREQVQTIIKGLNSSLMAGFEPQLVTVVSHRDKIIPTISFYIKLAEKTAAFWIIPDLRETEYAELTLEAIRILITKWTDRTLFNNTFTGIILSRNGDYDIYSIFSPVALYVFEYNSTHLEVDKYSGNIHSQAQNLKEQIRLLMKCKQ